MKETIKRAEEKLKEVMREFEPTKGHFVAGAREFLLALRSVVDAQISLLDKATKKETKPGP
jgi:glutamate formiminotransferase